MQTLTLLLEELTETSGLNIKTKVGSSWVDPIPSVNVAGTWTKVKKAYGKVGNSWKPTYEYESVYTLATGVQVGTIDFDSLSLDRYHNVRVVVPSGATLVAPSTSTYAVKTGTSHNAKITLENKGAIFGRGGDGGDGGYRVDSSNMPDPEDGFNGGSAIFVESNITVINNGTILGGAGGGGGGEGTYVYRHSGGGGGGGGAPYGVGGAGKTTNGGTPRANGATGATASLTTGGVGGRGAYTSNHNGLEGGAGGTGGDVGSSGSNGGYQANGDVYKVTGVGAGGSNGASYYNPSSFTIS